MVEAKALLFRVDRKIDRLHTEHTPTIKAVDICSAATEAEFWLLKDRVQRAEQDKTLRHALLPLEVKEKFMPVTGGTTESIIAFPPDYYRDLGIRICVSKRGCGKKEIALTKMETGDKNKSLTDPFWKTSFFWEQIFGDEGADGLHVYNGTDCKVIGMIIDYYRIPPEVHCPSAVIPPDKYIDWNGVAQTEDQGWVLDELFDEGVNLIAMMLKGDIGDFRDFQLQQSNNMQTVQISKL